MSALALRAPLGEPQFSASLAQPVTRWSHIWKLGSNFHQLWDSLCSDRTHTHNLSSHTHSVTTLWFLHHVLIVVRELKAHQPACTIFPCFSVCLYILSLSVYLKKYLFLSYVHLCFDHGSQVPGTGITDSCELPCGHVDVDTGNWTQVLWKSSQCLTGKLSLQPNMESLHSPAWKTWPSEFTEFTLPPE